MSLYLLILQLQRQHRRENLCRWSRGRARNGFICVAIVLAKCRFCRPAAAPSISDFAQELQGPEEDDLLDFEEAPTPARKRMYLRSSIFIDHLPFQRNLKNPNFKASFNCSAHRQHERLVKLYFAEQKPCLWLLFLYYTFTTNLCNNLTCLGQPRRIGKIECIALANPRFIYNKCTIT